MKFASNIKHGDYREENLIEQLMTKKKIIILMKSVKRKKERVRKFKGGENERSCGQISPATSTK